MLRNLLLILLCLGTMSAITAQDYQDDFESYDVGAYIGVESSAFTTWSGTTGTTEDAKIVDSKAKSGEKSIYFYSTAMGPQDVVIDFGQKYTTGVFNLKFDIFVTENTSAYWNFQQETTIGTTWAGNAYYRNDNTLSIDAGTEVINTPFQPGEWNSVEYDIDLDNNEWIIRINDVCVGTLLAPAAVASLDIFPLTQNSTASEFWIDDVSFDYTETMVEKELDVVLSGVSSSGPAFVGSSVGLQASITNTGTVKVDEVELLYSIDGGSGSSETFSNIDLEPGETYLVELADALNPNQGVNVVDLNISMVNGLGSDDVACNNNVVTGVIGIKLADDKRVVVEEATGTWCTWCVRGHVFMERMEEKYADRFIGIAVHNGDPMAVEEYDSYVGSFPGFSGYPNAIVDRSSVVDPSGLEVPIVTRVQMDVKSTFEITATYDPDLKELVPTVTVFAKEDIPSTYRLVVVLVEDDVTGTSSGYNQINAYAGGGNGEMGGYENLPSPVPASQMVYEDVARALFTPANGMAVGEKIEAGQSKEFTFGVELTDEMETEHLRIVAFLAQPSPVRQIDNAFEVHFEDVVISNSKDFDLDIAVKVFPNQARDITNITLDLGNSGDVEIQLFSMSGQLISSRAYGTLSGKQVFTVDAENLTNGIYSAVISVDGKKINKKIVVSH